MPEPWQPVSYRWSTWSGEEFCKLSRYWLNAVCSVVGPEVLTLRLANGQLVIVRRKW